MSVKTAPPVVVEVGRSHGHYVFEVRSGSRRDLAHEVRVCDSTGAVLCSCEDYWFNKGCERLPWPMIDRPASWCKHIRAALSPIFYGAFDPFTDEGTDE